MTKKPPIDDFTLVDHGGPANHSAPHNLNELKKKKLCVSLFMMAFCFECRPNSGVSSRHARLTSPVNESLK